MTKEYTQRRWLGARSVLSTPESRLIAAWWDLADLRRMDAPQYMIDAALEQYNEIVSSLGTEER